MKTLIAVQGPASCGKSSSIWKAFEFLLRKFPDAEVEYLKRGVDLCAILTIGAKSIGIESQGDPNSRLRKSLRVFEKRGCAIIVCATRTGGQTVEAVKAMIGYQISWLQKRREVVVARQGPANVETAQKIVGDISGLL